MSYREIIKELRNLLYWTMLAATTVGPGTVVTCARAGAEYQLHLVWALIFASILAYTLQEGTARLTIVSGKSLGECLQLKYSHGRKIWNVGLFCWLVVGLVFIGNTLLECNCFAGGIAAVYALPPVEQATTVRWISSIVYAAVVIAVLFANKTDLLGVGLGIVTISMVALFLILVIRLGLDGIRFAKGLIPFSIPNGSINIVLSLIGTTSLGFNLFLGGEMARGQQLPNAQRGIAFSTFMACIISILILIVGDGSHGNHKGVFTIATLADIIQRLSGKIGTWVFGIGFIAAALSSMLTIPLGAAMTADSILTIHKVENDINVSPGRVNKIHQSGRGEFTVDQSESLQDRPFPKKYYMGLMFVQVIISTVVIGANAPRVLIILIAQVFNGCLLPFFSTCLLICINDPRFMGKSPQKGWANCCLISVVWITIFLTSNTIIQNVFGWTVTKHYTTINVFQRWNFIASAISSVVVTILIFILTDLKKNVKKNFSIFKRRSGTVGVST